MYSHIKNLLLLFAFTCLNTNNDCNKFVPTTKMTSVVPFQKNFILLGCKFVFDKTCPDIDITFHLYSQKYPEAPETINFTSKPFSSNLNKTAFNSTVPNKLIIHGFNSSMRMKLLLTIKSQYLLRSNYNIFYVNWENLCKSPCYPAAVWNLEHVGECTAQFIERLMEVGGTNIHIIGFSLGAQMGNYIANTLKPKKITRITGLDPSMPGFIFTPSDRRLDEDDANFVDVIHTNAFMQGTFLLSGHVDFFMNGGVTQPGCLAETRYIRCNHHRASIYFAESINTNLGFYGWRCKNYFSYFFYYCPPNEEKILLGEYINFSVRGIYWALTRPDPPFAAGKYAENYL